MPLSRSIQVNAPAEQVWELVSDLPAMGSLSPENVGGRWRKGATGPAVGARFRGHNRKGWRRWSTDVVVTSCEPPQRLVFKVSSFGVPVAEWGYDVAPTDQGCTVTESWSDRRPGWFKRPAGLVTGGGYADMADIAANLDTTLAALKQMAERGPVSS